MADCILSKFKMVNLSLLTHTRSVSERLPYPIITDLDSNAADHPFQVLSPKTIIYHIVYHWVRLLTVVPL